MVITTLLAFSALTPATGSLAGRSPAMPPIGQQRPPVTGPPLQPLPGQRIPLPGQRVPKLLVNTQLWGFADLHAHPANHMSYGADVNGNGGVFWGKPGVALVGANPLADMPACSTDSHYGFDSDPVRKGTRQHVIAELDGLTGFVHGPNGAPSFQHWPHAQSVIHQQMHITAIKRAYDGGLRLMFASVADNQMLSMLWTKVGFNLVQQPLPVPDPNHDYNCAKRQITYIRQMASANPTWMQIVRTAAEARQAIADNKLALILSLEMDSLTSAQILDLKTNWDARSVVPIHLADNSFGGSAIYGDLFNASTNFLNGSFFRVNFDPLLTFRLGTPQKLQRSDANSIKPVDADPGVVASMGYKTGVGGHKNKLGVNGAELQKLMKAGMLIDLAHMSEAAINQSLNLAKQFDYPVLNSHTGIRNASEQGTSERDLKRSEAKRIGELGGVIGLGTEGKTTEMTLKVVKGTPVVRFTGGLHVWTTSLLGVPLPGTSISNLRVTIETSTDDLRGGNDNFDAELKLKSGQVLSFKNLNKGQGLANGSRKTFTLPIGNVSVSNLSSFSLKTAFTGGLFGDNWDISEVKLFATQRHLESVAQWLSDYQQVLAIMGGKGVALGTDMNGFAPQLPFAVDSVVYPNTVASKYGPPHPGFVPPPLAKSMNATRGYSFQTDGLAHYGMLPDLFAAVSAMAETPGSAAAMQAMYRSADDVVRMWEKVEAAKARVP